MGRTGSMSASEIIATSEYLQRISPWVLMAHDPKSRDIPIHNVLSPGALDSALEGLSWMEALDAKGVQTAYDFYTDEQKRRDPDMAATQLLYAPGKPGAPFVVVCPGGAYCDVWTIAEGFNTMAAFAARGYHAFSLVYRVNQKGLLPKPAEDLANAVAFICANAARFGLDAAHYAVTGYSAGGHLAAMWGSDNHGWRAYHAPKPDALFLGYPALSTLNFLDDLAAHAGDEAYAHDALSYLSHFTSGEPTREALAEYSVELHADAAYPPAYLIHSRDDPAVHYQTSVMMDKRLTELGVPHVFETVEHCGHGFAVGRGMQAEGWLDRAMDFWRSQKNA